MNNNEKKPLFSKLDKIFFVLSFVAIFLMSVAGIIGCNSRSSEPVTASAAVYNSGSTHAVIGLSNSGYDIVYTNIGIRNVTTNPNNYGQLLLMDVSGNLLSNPIVNPENAEPFTIGGYTYNYGRQISFYGTFTNVDGQRSSGLAIHALLYSQSIEFPEVSTDYTPEIILYSGNNYRFTDYFSDGDLYVSTTGSELFGVTAYCYDYITTRTDDSGEPIHSRFIVVFPTLNVKGFTTSTYVARSTQINYQPDIDGAYTQGYQAGVEYADGRVNPDSLSYQAGEEAGFNRGVISDTDYSMKSLFLALFDAPLTIIQEGLNFEFFGVNLAGFLLSLLTLALAVFILRTFFFK